MKDTGERMATIIAGRAETQVLAARAVEALRSAGFAASDITSFYLNPPGQHAEYPIGGDAHHDEGTKHSGKTATAGAAIGGVTGAALGAAVGAAAEPGVTAIAGIAGAGVGAYVGSLAGGLKGARAGDAEQAHVDEPVEREAGMMVAVRVDGNDEAAIQALRAQGVRDIERATGEWRDGSWVDFDPRRTPQVV
jgi:phage tail tape-measure protein